MPKPTTATIRALGKELKRIKTRIAKIDGINNARPVRRWIEIQKEALALLKKHRGTETDLEKLLKPLVKEEKQLKKTMDAQTNPKLFDEQLKLESDAREIEGDLFMLKMRLKS